MNVGNVRRTFIEAHSVAAAISTFHIELSHSVRTLWMSNVIDKMYTQMIWSIMLDAYHRRAATSVFV